MSAVEAPGWVHPFERAGLGKAPFRVVAYELRKYQACPGAPVQCGGSCDACGTGIMHTFIIRGADQGTFKVGSDCVEKTGDTELREAARREQRAYERAERQAAWRAKHEEEERVRRETLAERRRGACEAFALWLVAMDEVVAVAEGDRTRDLAARVSSWIRNGNSPGNVEVSWASRAWADYVAESQSRHVGQVGERLKKVRATVVGCIPLGDSGYGRRYIWLLDFAGNRLVWFTTGRSERDGTSVVLSATVKEHGLRDGIAQTVVTRCSVEKEVRRCAR